MTCAGGEGPGAGSNHNCQAAGREAEMLSSPVYQLRQPAETEA